MNADINHVRIPEGITEEIRAGSPGENPERVMKEFLIEESWEVSLKKLPQKCWKLFLKDSGRILPEGIPKRINQRISGGRVASRG